MKKTYFVILKPYGVFFANTTSLCHKTECEVITALEYPSVLKESA